MNCKTVGYRAGAVRRFRSRPSPKARTPQNAGMRLQTAPRRRARSARGLRRRRAEVLRQRRARQGRHALLPRGQRDAAFGRLQGGQGRAGRRQGQREELTPKLAKDQGRNGLSARAFCVRQEIATCNRGAAQWSIER